MATATDGGWTLKAREVLADVIGTYIVVDVEEHKGLWEFNGASLMDEKGRRYTYCGCHRDCGVLTFEPLAEDAEELTLTVKKMGLVRDPNCQRTGLVRLSKETLGERLAKLPADVREKLKSWGFLGEESVEEDPSADEEELARWNDYYSRQILGLWTLRFTVSTEARKKYSSVIILDRKIPFFNGFLSIKRLVKGLLEWVIDYKIVDDRGRDEHVITYDKWCEKYYDKFISLVRESSTREECLDKGNTHTDTWHEHQDNMLPRCSFHLRCGSGSLSKQIFETPHHLASLDSCLLFPPPVEESPLVLAVTAVENARSLAPHQCEIALLEKDGHGRFPFSIDFASGHYDAMLYVTGFQRDYDESWRIRDGGESIRKHLSPEAAEQYIQEHTEKRLRITYYIETGEGERIFFDEPLDLKDERGTSYECMPGPCFLIGGVWEGEILIRNMPHEVQRITVTGSCFSILYPPGKPLEIMLA